MSYGGERKGSSFGPDDPGPDGDTLLGCVRRASRLGWGGPNRWTAVILSPAGPEHRRRVASALLAQEAETAAGRVFAMASGEEVLLCPAPADALRRHLSALHPEGNAPVTWLSLPHQSPELLSYARREPEMPAPAPPLPTGLRRQTVVLAGGRLRPLFQSVRPAGDRARLEAADLPDVLPRLLAWTRLGAGCGLHVACSLHAVLSPAFGRFVSAVEQAGLADGLGVAVPLLEAVADLQAWTEAAASIRAHRATVVVDGIAHAALSLVDPAMLGPDLVELAWSAEMIEGGPGLDIALRQIGADRLVINGADAETALRWGLSRGIKRFGGRQVDVMLAGMRMSACLAAASCTVRQCADRAAATSPAGRAGCVNPGHLNPGHPQEGARHVHAAP